MLEIVGELVEATADEEAPQLPRDLNTTNEIITETLDLLFHDLDTTTGQNETNVTVDDVSLLEPYYCIFCIKLSDTRCNFLNFTKQTLQTYEVLFLYTGYSDF